MLFQKMIHGHTFDNRLCKGESQSNDYGTTTSTYDPAQGDFYKDLLNRSQAWLNNGGMQTNDYSGQMRNALDTQAAQYQEMINGGYDETALNNAMNANSQAATQSFQRNVLPALGTQANMAGQAGSSRAGIAEGLAASDLNSQIAQQNANMIWNAEQQAAQRKMAGVQGMGNLFAGYNQLGQYENQLANTGLESLLTYKNLIGGNMGGTENSVKREETSAETGAGFI